MTHVYLLEVVSSNPAHGGMYSIKHLSHNVCQ